MKKLLIYLAIIFLAWTGAAMAADVTLAWDANTEPEVTGYKLYWSTVNEIPFTDSVDVQNVTQYTIPDLTEGTTYYFAATAYSATQESQYSDILAYVVQPGRVIIRVLDRPKSIRAVFE